MKKVVVLLVFAVVVLVGYIVLDKSGIELPSFDPKKAYEQGEVFYNNKEYYKAFESFKKACDGGEMLGCYSLGDMYANGNGVEKNEQKAVKLYEKVCYGGEMRGCRNLGFMYYNGNGIRQNKLLAKGYFGKACDLGDEESCEEYKQTR